MRLLTNAPRDIERAIRDPHDAPKGFAEYPLSGLPDPKAHPLSVIYVTDLDTLALSNGVYWYPVQLGAAL